MRLRVWTALIVLTFFVFCCGCSSTPEPTNDDTELENSASQEAELGEVETKDLTESEQEDDSDAASSLFSNPEWPENDATAVLPKPDFSSGPTSTATTEGFPSATIEYDGLSDSEVVQYVDQLKDAGFIYSVSESKEPTRYHYSADNAEYFMNGSSLSVEYAAKSDDKPSHLFISIQRNDLIGSGQ